MVINHNDVNKNSFHQGPPPMSSNLLQYLWDCWDLVCGGATVRLRERPALDVMYSISSSPSRLHWSKEGSLSAGGGCVWWYCCFRLEHNAKQIGGKKNTFTARTSLLFFGDSLRIGSDEKASKQTRRNCPCAAYPRLFLLSQTMRVKRSLPQANDRRLRHCCERHAAVYPGEMPLIRIDNSILSMGRSQSCSFVCMLHNSNQR